MVNFKTLFGFIFLLSVNVALAAHHYLGDLNLAYRDYATLSSAQTLSLNVGVASNYQLQSRPKFELEVNTYFENNANSEYYYDLGKSLYRIGLNDQSFLSIGRYHPLEELNPNYKSNHLDALGTNWVINEQNPLDINTSGWIGIGPFIRLSEKSSLIFQYSPLFIPTIGPTITYSKSDIPKSQSPFARKPPTRVRLNDEAYFPIRVTLDNVNIKDIVLQNQYFLGLNYKTGLKASFSLFAYSAPSPVPTTSSKEKLIIEESDIHILVDANPTFERENNLGFSFNSSYFEFQSLYKLITHKLTLSTSLKFETYFAMGVLHTFGNTNDSEDPTVIISPIKDEKLLWMSAETGHFYSFKLRGKVLKNLGKENDGTNLNLGIESKLNNVSNIYGEVQVFAGGDRSYYGTWRSLDFIAFGVTSLW